MTAHRMTVHVKLFAILRDRAGTPGLSLDLPPGSTVAAAAAALAECLPPAAREHLRRAAYAVNLAYAGPETVLEDGDELALIPPVSGGSGAAQFTF